MLENPRSLGVHIKKRRLELRLLQSDVADIFNVCEDTITGWENGRNKPQIHYYPKLIGFLGYNPIPVSTETLGDRIKKYRIEHGLSIKRLARIIKVEERTLVSWEENKVVPKGDKYENIKELIS